MLNICLRVVLVMLLALHCPFSIAPLMALAWDSDLDAPCCAHRVRHHRDHIREFSCGKRYYYRTFYQDPKRGVLYIGAMDRIMRVNLSNISHTDCKKDALVMNPTGPSSCVSKGKSEDFDCRNHIRVIQAMGDGDRLYVCGTNAHNPKDWVINLSAFLETDSNLTPLPRQTFVPGIGEGTARCPYDPSDNSTAVWVESGNPDNLSGLYSGTNAEFTKADTVIFRTDLYNLTTGERKHPFKRTLKYDSKWLDKPSFVGSYDIGEYVYFFFREPAVEYMNCGKNIYSRVARVCKKDTGGKNILVQNWATYLKARLNCSIPGEIPFYFNEIQAIYRVPGDDTRFYAVFTTTGSGFHGSALCVFTLDAIQDAFKGKFKEQATSSSAWLPVLSSKVPEPRPGECVNDTQTLPDTVLNFIRSHPLMDEAVAHENGKPAFYMQDLTFTHLVVDKIPIPLSRQVGDHYTVYFAGTHEGKIYKVVQWRDSEGESRSELIDILEGTYPEPVRAMDISSVYKSIYVGSDYRVRQIGVNPCRARYDSCVRCVRDPYCGWDTKEGICKPYSLGLLQNVGGNGAICSNCRRCSQMKRVVANWGQSLHLQCSVTLPGHSSSSLVSQAYKWYHYATPSQNNQPQAIKYSSEKHVLTSDRGLVILSVSETDGGQWQLRFEEKDISLTQTRPSLLLCAFNVSIEIQKCSAPEKASDFQKVYAEWCHEFQKYKESMAVWQRRQEQCGKKISSSGDLSASQHNHQQLTNDIFQSSHPYG
ncbi:semaphorin-2A isoform X2 [Folsomia candida]|uniref:semaphorin-2A isoform X2 n=1 Tax=Folsomia candida TaxID=158441 RepID=UPI000B8F6DA3|nr:semaphorin-2A isoform X2 [Folsomia candida]